jgi:hypothetical protein
VISLSSAARSLLGVPVLDRSYLPHDVTLITSRDKDGRDMVAIVGNTAIFEIKVRASLIRAELRDWLLFRSAEIETRWFG